MKAAFKEFKDFIKKGNVVDLAVAVVMGTAFSSIVNSVVNDIIMPLVGIIIGGVNFTNLKISIPNYIGQGNVDIMIGNFIQAVINFLLIALALFFIVKAMNKLMSLKKNKEEEPAKPEPVKSDELKTLEEIRDLLKKQNKNK